MPANSQLPSNRSTSSLAGGSGWSLRGPDRFRSLSPVMVPPALPDCAEAAYDPATITEHASARAIRKSDPAFRYMRDDPQEGPSWISGGNRGSCASRQVAPDLRLDRRPTTFVFTVTAVRLC